MRRPATALPGLPLLGIAVALAVLILGCGDTGESRSTVSAFETTRASQERKLRRLQRRLHLRRQEMREARDVERAKDAAATELLSEPRPSNRVAGRSFSSFESRLPGMAGATIGPPGKPASLRLGRLTSGSAWSTIKVPIVLAVLRDRRGPDGLSPSQAANARAALTLSDNDAAAALFGDLERRHGGTAGAAGSVTAVLREASDATTTVSTEGRDGFSPYGQTKWPLRAQHLFMSRLAGGCLRESHSSQYVLSLMGKVRSDTWGLGSAGLAAHWKGGWGPGVDGRYLVRQMGFFEIGGRRTIVTLAATSDDGSFETARSVATSVARWLARKAPRFAGASGC